MPREAGGTYVLPEDDVTSGTTILAEWANNTLNDIATAMTDSLSRTGVGGMSAPLKMPNGSKSDPAYTFLNDTTTGRFLETPGVMVESISGTDVVRYTINGIEQKVAGGGWEPVSNQDASEVPYDDSVTNFGVDNVQDAIEAASVVDQTYVTVDTAQDITGVKTFPNGFKMPADAGVLKENGDNLLVYGGASDLVAVGNYGDDLALLSDSDSPMHYYDSGNKSATILTEDNFMRVAVNLLYPVGAVVLGVDDPSTRWPGSGTTWQKIEGRFILGDGEGTDINGRTVDVATGSEWGEYTHPTTVEEMPRHAHEYWGGRAVGPGAGYTVPAAEGDPGNFTAHTGGLDTAGEVETNGEPHNNLPPYHAVPIWKRIT